MEESPIRILQEFIKYEASSSIILLIMSFFALAWANSPWQQTYFNLFNYQFFTTLTHFINDGLMSFFFLLVTLEVKRELIEGELNTVNKAMLPIIAALGGMVVPAIIYLGFNISTASTLHGWAIPTATDIAFSLAILLLLRSLVPNALKSFLTALAIIDDIGAIIIIAFFYSEALHVYYLLLSGICTLVLLLLNRLAIKSLFIYFIVGSILWLLIYKSGIHSTITGVILGFMIPLQINKSPSPLKKLEHYLTPWVSLCILPLFALANTGLVFSKINLSSYVHPITLGIFFGLFLGKQTGVFLACWVAHKLRIAKLPALVKFRHIYGVSILCGIGFTMSLFIGELAFKNQEELKIFVKLGVFTASCASALAGALWLWGVAQLNKK